jgi:hypothetical protein
MHGANKFVYWLNSFFLCREALVVSLGGAMSIT